MESYEQVATKILKYLNDCYETGKVARVKSVVSGNDIIKKGAKMNVLNRGIIEWKKETKTKSTE
ncbi:hypothetical protein FC40_GL000502 [Ligilactobacillus hayakitensis DSM 18933 = JCM 14209]|uniref:Uncharacterized protein n=1 Tax=Ligilactobacillus hayakitensis DSM 18933 = JCM 14209 TaxID=1423755 RepID=A0A0R1WN41_9LACO|nr:hypothetical protein [Ligilactobacillus hayakitensis]KRM19202.1 hypothetical protein FC40_GL000502 [Ligilactobacillus hayakitensis DSM 18933 = JCM 14209]